MQVDRVVADMDGREITYGDISKLEYLDMVFSESMRLTPSVPMAQRTCTKDCVLSNGLEVKAGTNVIFSISGIFCSSNYAN